MKRIPLRMKRLKTNVRAVIKLAPGTDPASLAPFADAGITAYHAVKKQLSRIIPGTNVVVLGVGGLGHFGVQILKALSPAQLLPRCRRSKTREMYCTCSIKMLRRGGTYSQIGYGGTLTIGTVACCGDLHQSLSIQLHELGQVAVGADDIADDVVFTESVNGILLAIPALKTPSTRCKSVRHTPAPATRTITSSGPVIFGSATSTSLGG